MRPENTRVWRKTGRAATKGVPTGRRGTHKAETQQHDNTTPWEQERRRRRAGLPLQPYTTPDGA